MTTTALINEYHALDAQHEAIKQRLASGDENASLELGRIMARKREIALAIFAPAAPPAASFSLRASRAKSARPSPECGR